MQNTLSDLNNYLFEQIERVNDDSLDDEALEKEIHRAETVTKIAGTIINNAQLQLNAIKHMDEYGYTGEKSMPALITGNSNQQEGNL